MSILQFINSLFQGTNLSCLYIEAFAEFRVLHGQDIQADGFLDSTPLIVSRVVTLPQCTQAPLELVQTQPYELV